VKGSYPKGCLSHLKSFNIFLSLKGTIQYYIKKIGKEGDMKVEITSKTKHKLQYPKLVLEMLAEKGIDRNKV